jgi:hypothetical protein
MKDMTETPVNNIYEYTAQQAEVVRLHDRFRRCLMDQKYYAYRLSTYQRWDMGTNLIAGIAMLFSLATRDSTGRVSVASYALGAIAALLFIGKPIFKVSDQIERYTILCCGFSECFHRIESLIADIRNADEVSADHHLRAAELFHRCAHLAIREDVSVNHKRLKRFKEEVEQAIPKETLWLPSK